MQEWIMNLDPLAAWGALLSTLLASREIYKSRTSIEIGYKFTSLEEIGNEVTIRNLSGHPIIVKYWELVWCKRRLLKWAPFKSIDPGEDISDIHVPEHSSTSLIFSDQDHFDWSQKSLNGGAIFLRIYIAGRSKPIFLRLYG